MLIRNLHAPARNAGVLRRIQVSTPAINVIHITVRHRRSPLRDSARFADSVLTNLCVTTNMAQKKKHSFPKIPHKPGVRDLVSVREAKKLQDLLPSKRRDRLAKIYGYKA
jgi:hypothetical protein